MTDDQKYRRAEFEAKFSKRPKNLAQRCIDNARWEAWCAAIDVISGGAEALRPEKAVTLDQIVDVLHCCDSEAQTIANRISGPLGKANQCPDGVQVLKDAETIIRAAFMLVEALPTPPQESER